MTQVLINAIVSAGIYSLVGLSFAILYETGRWFNFFQAVIITIGAYAMYVMSRVWHIPFALAVSFAVAVAIAFGVAFENGPVRAFRRRGVSSWGLLLMSLGAYTVIQNIISLFFGDSSKSVRSGIIHVGHRVFDGYITDIQLITLATAVCAYVLVTWFLRATALGLAIRGVSSNPSLCEILGVDADRTTLWAVVIASALGAMVGILVALDTDMTPTMGFPLLLNGVIVMIIGGVGSYRSLLGAAFLLAASQHLVAFYVGSKWMDAISFIILIAFLVWKPLGFSGRRLRQIEI